MGNYMEKKQALDNDEVMNFILNYECRPWEKCRLHLAIKRGSKRKRNNKRLTNLKDNRGKFFLAGPLLGGSFLLFKDPPLHENCIEFIVHLLTKFTFLVLKVDLRITFFPWPMKSCVFWIVLRPATLSPCICVHSYSNTYLIRHK